MSTKTTFKRIALVAVAALGLGVLSVAPSSATLTDPVLTVGTPSATTVGIGETVTVSIDFNFITDAAGDTQSVSLVGSGDGFASHILIPLTTDSANVTNHGVGVEQSQATGTTAVQDTITATNSGQFTRAKWTAKLYNADVAGTYTYTIVARQGTTSTIHKSATFTITVTAANTTGDSTKSLMWLNKAYTSGAPSSRADSALVVSAYTAASPQTVGYLVPEFRNSSDTTTASNGSFVNDSMTVVVSGPGLLTTQSSRASVPSDSTKSKSVKVSQGDTVVVWSDGTAGVGTFTASIGGVNLTQAAKTITFFGKPATIVATVESKTVASSGTANGVISFIVKDSAGIALTATNAVFNTGTPGGGFFAVYADTKVVNGTAVTSTGSAAYTACTTSQYNSTATRWECNLPIIDSGTASIVIADSYTAATSVASSAAVSFKAAAAGYTGTAAFDKASYTAGEKAILTMTSKDRLGNFVIDGTSNPFASLKWGDKSPTFTSSSASEAAGGTFTDLITYLTSTNTFVEGVDTAIVYMPSIAGTYTLTGTTNGVDKAAFSLTFTVVDPTKDAADAATDAALEATDAAYAAQDAAQLAAEAADAATAAAEAATAAVEDLATQVASLFADLQKQITTLANVVAKIAKKVKA